MVSDIIHIIEGGWRSVDWVNPRQPEKRCRWITPPASFLEMRWVPSVMPGAGFLVLRGLAILDACMHDEVRGPVQ